MNPHRSVFSQYPLAQLAVAFGAGVCATQGVSLKLGMTLTAGVMCSAVALVLLVKNRLRAAGVALLFGMFFVGAMLATLERRADGASDVRRVVTQADDDNFTLTGVLDGPPEFARDRLYLSLRVESIDDVRASGRVTIVATFRSPQSELEYRSLQLRYGTRVRISATLDRTGNYRNPGVSSLAEYLDGHNYDASGVV